ncbi:MAG: hypothetical protein P4M04_16450 [Acidobacteriota bacterium]|nr:hypothetical protein [Acidobacteriota bacterium]
MRKLLSLLTLLALTLAAVGAFAATVYKTVPRTTSGKPVPTIQGAKFDPHSLASFKAQNHLTYAMNQKIRANAGKAPKDGYIPGVVNTVPYFQGWFITGSRNSIYPFATVGGSPTNGGTTTLNTQLIPLITVLLVGGVQVAEYDPTIPNDPQGDDMTLITESPLYDATTTYPGPPADTGQIVDTAQRVAYHTYGNWHTELNATSSGVVWIQFLEFNNGDWTFACCDSMGNNFPVFNINTISNNFAFILATEAPANTTAPVIVTDYLTAFDPSSGGCCILGYHTAQPNTDINGPGVLVWGWSTYIAHSEDNPFGAFGEDTMVLSHEISELVNDPFVDTNVSPYVDGSVSFAQANLETGDCIEAMAAPDVIWNVPLSTGGGPYTYTLQNTCTLDWFRRNPFNGGIYSWPNEHTLGQAPHPVGCTAGPPSCWSYGEGSAGFYFGPPY